MARRGRGVVTAPLLACFGLGYTARAWLPKLLAAGWRVRATGRGEKRLAEIAALGAEPVPFGAPEALDGATHVLSSAPPGDSGDPALAAYGPALAALRGAAWIGYLSATSVYGDRGGGEADEETPIAPASRRGRRRAAAEAGWLALGGPAHVFRLSGIYGPGRSAFDRIRAGAARRIDKPGHKFSRIHAADAAAALAASAAAPEPGAIYNLCDDEPAASADVIAHACALLGRAPPPLVPFAEAVRAMPPLAREFWADDRRVSNARMKRLLGRPLRYPTYREGLAAILAAERRGAAPARGCAAR